MKVGDLMKCKGRIVKVTRVGSVRVEIDAPTDFGVLRMSVMPSDLAPIDHKPLGMAAAARIRDAQKIAEQETVRLGGYTLTRLGGVVWLMNPDGEGMATTPDEVAAELGKFFRRKF